MNGTGSSMRHFKELVRGMVYLLARATGVETVSLHWVNRSRGQFVLETGHSDVPGVQFPDRIPMSQSFLKEAADLAEPVEWTIGTDLPVGALSHYLTDPPVSHITLLPFVYNGETVSVTVLESSEADLLGRMPDVIQEYLEAMRHLLVTFLELSEADQDDSQWEEYERLLRQPPVKGEDTEHLKRLGDQLIGLVPNGSVSLFVRGQERWQCLWSHPRSMHPIEPGTPVEANSLLTRVLHSGQPECGVGGDVTLAVPVLLYDRRLAVWRISSPNMLFFKEANQHKLVNLVRVASLRMTQAVSRTGTEGDWLAGDTGAFRADVFDAALRLAVARSAVSVGYISLRDLHSLRARHRMDTLRQIQWLTVNRLAPVVLGLPGLIGQHADFLYTILLPAGTTAATWTAAAEKALAEPLRLADGSREAVRLITAWTESDDRNADPYDLKREARRRLDQLMRSTS